MRKSLKTAATMLSLLIMYGAGCGAQTPEDPSPPSTAALPNTLPPDQQAAIDAAVAARKQRCRQQPGICRRGAKTPATPVAPSSPAPLKP